MRRSRGSVLAALAAALGMAAAGCGDSSEVTDATTPDTQQSTDADVDPNPPDVAGEDATAPDATTPDTAAPDATTPDTAAPDATAPDSTTPDTTPGDTTVSCTESGCQSGFHCAVDGKCVADVCAAGTTYCKDGDVYACNAGGTAETRASDCLGFGCEGATCVPGPTAIEIASIGTDLVNVAQAIQLSAVVYDDHGQPTTRFPVTWTSSDPALLAISGAGLVTGVAPGGGDKVGPSGALFVTARAGGVETTMDLQVVRLLQGSGLQFKEIALSDDPNSDGRAHYDGVYTTATEPAISACNPYSGGNTCAWKIADARLFVGSSMQIDALGNGKWDTFGTGLLELPAILDADGIAVAPPTARVLATTWQSSDTSVATVKDGFVTGQATGTTTISATVGPQTWTLDLVVYDQYGYDPTNGFSQGVEPEDGHLMLFSSSAGMAMVGTHDAVRYVDLADYRNLDFRPSKYGPQGVRLVEDVGGVNEQYPGFGCGMVRGAGDVVWLFNGWTAVPFDTKQAKQVGGSHKVAWRPDGAATGANSVCSGAFVQLGGRDYLIGFDTAPYDHAAFVADVTNIAAGNVDAVGIDDPLFRQSPIVKFYNPMVFEKEGTTWLLFTEQTPTNNAAAPNKLRAAALTQVGGDLVVTPDEAMTIATAPTPNPPDDEGEVPALASATVGGKSLIFIGNMDVVTVIDATTWSIVDFSGVGSTDPLLRDLDTRRFGKNIKGFATSPDGQTLFVLPESSYPITPWFNTKVEWKGASGATQSTKMTVHRLGLVDLSGAAPRLMIDPATDPKECFLLSGCTAETYQYGYDLNLLALKQWMLDTGFAPSTGAIIPPQAMNVRQVAVSAKSVFLIGRDSSDGVGTALGNMSDVAVIDRATGHMPVFRGWHGDPGKLRGLSDPFGFRLGEDDAVLGDVRVKSAAVLYLPGTPPAENAGDGVLHGDDVKLPANGAYANAAKPVTESGRVVLLSSSHLQAARGTHDVVRELDLSVDGWPESDFDPAVDGAQGESMSYEVMDKPTVWSGGCGTVTGPGGLVWMFNGDSAIAFDPDAMTQAMGGHQVTFDRDPANATARVCAGAFVEKAGHTYLYGINVDLRPNPKMFMADVTDLALGNITATPVESPFFAAKPDADPYTVRYVAALAHNGELWFLERNDPYHNLRNTVHRATVSAGGALTFDMTRESDITAGWTTSGDPNMIVTPVWGKPHLFVGNQRSISIYDLSGATPTRYDYNTDGDSVQDDLDTAWYGRGIQAFTVSPDGERLYALPWEKSAAIPRAYFTIPLLGGGFRTSWADRYRVVAISLTAPGKPAIDQTVNNGNGVDVNYYWFKQWIAATGETALPAMFPSFRRQFAASAGSLFLIGNDNDDGVGSALANAGDLATYDLATGKGHLWRGYEYVDINTASGLWGYDLGVDATTGVDDANLNGARAKNAGVLFLP